MQFVRSTCLGKCLADAGIPLRYMGDLWKVEARWSAVCIAVFVSLDAKIRVSAFFFRYIYRKWICILQGVLCGILTLGKIWQGVVALHQCDFFT